MVYRHYMIIPYIYQVNGTYARNVISYCGYGKSDNLSTKMCNEFLIKYRSIAKATYKKTLDSDQPHFIPKSM